MTLVSGVDNVSYSDITIDAAGPGSCGDSFAPVSLKNPCQDSINGSTTISVPSMVNYSAYIDDPSPVLITPPTFTDSVSTSNGNPTFCGDRQYSFKRVDTGATASDMITVDSNGDWRI